MISLTTPRVRFAPSPTGPLHIGGLRTALYNYLFAKKCQGTFVLRLEDTDQGRYVKGSENYILEALRWAGITPDEGFGIGGPYGPYIQSDRKEIYFSHIQNLLEKGLAYYSFDKPETLENLKKEAAQKGEVFNYSPLNRDLFDHSLKLTQSELEKRLKKKEPYVIRFKMPKRKNLQVFDQIRGKIFINTELLDDKILLKSDGMPTYHLASVVDDYLMKISHVIRGEEWLPSFALHILLYEAFGWEPPKFAHLPLILNPTGGGKLSKRHSGENNFLVFPLAWKDPKTNVLYKGYKEEGYSSEGFINMLALLGWNSGGEKEIFSLRELIAEFSIEKINKSGAKFDPKKAIWINSRHLQETPIKETTDLFLEKFPSLSSIFSKTKLEKILSELIPRANFIGEIYTQGEYFFSPPTSYEEKAIKKIKNIELLKALKKYLEALDEFTQSSLKREIENFVESNAHLKFIEVVQALRVSVVGALRGVDLFFILEMIGKKETLSRIENLISYLNKNVD